MKQRIEESLQRAAGQLPRADFAKIAAANVTPMEGHDAITRQQPARKKPIRLAAALAAACLVLVAAVGGWFWQFGTLDAIVDIDVNPGFEIRLNRAGRVLDILSLNEEAAGVLEGRNYRGWDLDDAIETLFFALARDGYWGQDTSAVLVSVAGHSTAASSELAAYVSDRIALATAGTAPAPSIASQPFQTDDALSERAAGLGISPGKMRLVLGILEQDAVSSEEELAAMNTGELIRLALEYSVPGLHAHTYAENEAPTQQPDSSLDSTSSTLPPVSNTVPSSSQPPASVPPAAIPSDDDDDWEDDDDDDSEDDTDDESDDEPDDDDGD